jgi:sugar (pentulose or hexulose) kinase
MISDATNRPIHRISSPREACARGAALTGAVGSKLVKNFHEVKHVIRVDKSFKPRTINVQKYQAMLSTFIKAYEKLADVFKDLARPDYIT